MLAIFFYKVRREPTLGAKQNMLYLFAQAQCVISCEADAQVGEDEAPAGETDTQAGEADAITRASWQDMAHCRT